MFFRFCPVAWSKQVLIFFFVSGLTIVVRYGMMIVLREVPVSQEVRFSDEQLCLSYFVSLIS